MGRSSSLRYASARWSAFVARAPSQPALDGENRASSTLPLPAALRASESAHSMARNALSPRILQLPRPTSGVLSSESPQLGRPRRSRAHPLPRLCLSAHPPRCGACPTTCPHTRPCALAEKWPAPFLIRPYASAPALFRPTAEARGSAVAHLALGLPEDARSSITASVGGACSRRMAQQAVE
ncbi:hypothetical protein C8R44DRAFT_32080 [Mycena epipterygia]|nr:hypothetical protein C8R44DRAFT_32080 [Mycena epipterygia]